VIVFSAYNVPTKDDLAYIASGTSTVQHHAVAIRDQLTEKNLFDNKLLVVSISRAVQDMAFTLADFLKSSLSGKYGLNVGVDANTLYTNMATLSMMVKLLQRVNKMGINPDLHIIPGCIGFQDDDVNKDGYFLLFVVNLPLCASAIWNPNNADYRALLPQKERKRIIEQGKEDEDNKSYSDTESDSPVNDGFEAKESQKRKPASHVFHRVLDYITDMSQYKALPLVYFKTTMKKVKKGQTINKNEPPVCDALEWGGSEIKMEGFPIYPTIAKLWRNLFQDGEKTPLLKIMVTVNAVNPQQQQQEITHHQEKVLPKSRQKLQQN
jgi:hypothetical protein